MNHVAKKGFTLVELMLAMSFISVLLVAITLTVIQISAIYNKGITLTDLNNSSRSLSTELQRSISSTAPFSIEAGTGDRYIAQGNWGGRLCIGQYSYIWNYGKALNNNSSSGTSLNVYTTTPNTQIRFVKAIDPNGAYCANPSQKIDPATAVEVMNSGDHTLVLHNFIVSSQPSAIDIKTNERLYTISFTIGTNDQAALTSDSTACLATTIVGANFTFCAVQQFTVVVRAGNGVQ
jgi:prepilin-type N-terminal cleavage/methylation domain-containing protein